MALFFWGVIGAVVSVAARFLSPDVGSARRAVPVGVVGAVALGIAACLLVGPPRNLGLSPGSVVVAVSGAAAFLYAYSLVPEKAA